MSKLIGDNYYFPIDGHFVSQKQVRINEILKDYDPNLELQWIPPNDRHEGDKAFRVIHRPLGKPAYLVCTADECDERLLAEVFHSDSRNRSGDFLSWLDDYNSAIKIYNAKVAEEKRQEAHEFAAAVIRNNKSYYRHGGIDFERPGHLQSRKTIIW